MALQKLTGDKMHLFESQIYTLLMHSARLIWRQLVQHQTWTYARAM